MQVLSYDDWWIGMDSNHRSHRQQIYSLPPLATREPIHLYPVIITKKNDFVNRFYIYFFIFVKKMGIFNNITSLYINLQKIFKKSKIYLKVLDKNVEKHYN